MKRTLVLVALLAYTLTVVAATRIRTSGGSFAPPVADLPASWGVSKFAGNPVIDVDDNPDETTEQYVPSPIQLANGEIWVYVKGNSRIYAWKSVDDGETFSLENGGDPVIAPVAATWEASFTLEASAVYDQPTDTIHIIYKGRDANVNNWAFGYATAPGSDPTDVTKYGSNPILTANAIESALGVGNITDLGTGDTVVIDGEYHTYFYALYGGEYHLLHATGTGWTDPVADAVLLDAQGGDTVVETPAVFRIPGIGDPVYVMFYARGGTLAAGRSIRAGSSSDGITWDFSDTTDVISPATGWEDDSAYSGHLLKKSRSPYLSPIIDTSGRWKFYYSGYDDTTGKANAGLAYLTPS